MSKMYIFTYFVLTVLIKISLSCTSVKKIANSSVNVNECLYSNMVLLTDADGKYAMRNAYKKPNFRLHPDKSNITYYTPLLVAAYKVLSEPEEWICCDCSTAKITFPEKYERTKCHSRRTIRKLVHKKAPQIQSIQIQSSNPETEKHTRLNRKLSAIIKATSNGFKDVGQFTVYSIDYILKVLESWGKSFHLKMTKARKNKSFNPIFDKFNLLNERIRDCLKYFVLRMVGYFGLKTQ